MNKLFSKIAAASVGLAMAVGVGVAVGHKADAAKAEDKTDVLTRESTGVEGTTYTEWADKTASSDAVYAGQSAGGNDSIQLRSSNSNSGIITTTSGGIFKSITVVWNSNTSNGRTLDIYGKSSAYESPTDLYDNSKKGTKLGSIVKGTSTELAVEDEYEYIGLRSNSGAMYITSITIVWGEKDVSAPSVTITTEGCEFDIGDKGTFTATKENADSESILWSSSDPAVISVDEATGEYEALARGAVVITATLSVSAKTSKVDFTVTESIDVETAVAIAESLASGESTKYSVTVTGVIHSVGGNGTKSENNYVWLKTSEKDQAFELYFGYNAVDGWASKAVAGNTVSAYGVITKYNTTCELTGISKFELVSSPYADEVETFIANYMHMDSDVEGQCNTYYDPAKAAFNALSDGARSLFVSSNTYKAAYDRLVAWAAAHGEELNSSNVLSLNPEFIEASNNGSTIIIIIAATFAITTFGAILLIRKKKHSK